jgi:putative tryptophan/tyrosine transport system substrate-binding protein
MRRREFITLLGSAAAAWPVASKAQQARKIARIGFLGAASASSYARQLEGFRSGLRDLGYIEDANIVITYRWAEGNYARLPELAAELIRSDVDVVVTHGTPGTVAAKQATATIPIVIASVGDPVASGIVTGLAHPGENITGSSWFGPDVESKRVELLKEMMPRLGQLAALYNPDNQVTQLDLQAMETTAQKINVGLQQFPVREPREFADAFEKMERGHVEAIVIQDEGMLIANMGALAALAMKQRLPAIGDKSFAQAGGLMGYGVDFVAQFRRAAAFVDKILKGAKPADIPIERATKFELVFNLKAAKALGLDVPTSTLLRADEVIE